MFGTSYFDTSRAGFELLQNKARFIELKKQIDSERLAKNNYKLQSKLLEMKIKRFKSTSRPLKLPSISPNTPVPRPKQTSLTPHPIRLKSKFPN